jgi:hypothetical protein
MVEKKSEPNNNMSKYYQEFTPEIVAKWEEILKETPDAEWNCNKLSEVLPFIKKVMPRIGKNQSLFGLSIISLEGQVEDRKVEEKIVRYGLEPLKTANILSDDNIKEIVDWYALSDPKWGPHDYATRTRPNFEKKFEIDGKTYRLSTDNYRNFKDLNLLAVKS